MQDDSHFCSEFIDLRCLLFPSLNRFDSVDLNCKWGDWLSFLQRWLLFFFLINQIGKKKSKGGIEEEEEEEEEMFIRFFGFKRVGSWIM